MDLDAGLLTGVMRFATARAAALAGAVANTPESLLASVLGAAPSTAALGQLDSVRAAVQTHLTASRAALATLQATMATPPATLSDVLTATTSLAGVLREVAGATATVCTAVTGAPASVDTAMQTLIRAAATAGGNDFGGLVADLGLAPPGTTTAGSLTVAGTLVMCTLGRADARGVGPADLFVLHDSRLDVSFDWTQPASLRVRLAGKLDIGFAADGLLLLLMGGNAKVGADFVVIDDLTLGLRFGDGTKHRLAVPGTLNLQVAKLQDFTLTLPDAAQLASGSSRPGIELTATIAGGLGPAKAVVDGFGLALAVDPDVAASGSGSALEIEALPPTGAGLEIKAGPVHGGGYVMHRGDEYGGALELALGPVDIKAFGLISTEPFSLIVVLSVEFSPAIQLSFGFTLNGVGGLLAIDRGLDGDALAAGIHSHVVDNLLFPADPVSIAPRLLGMLDADFPRKPGGFVVGPMVTIGWGEPISFVTAQIGIILALPDVEIVILGVLRMALPSPDAPIIDIHAELLGEISSDHVLVVVSLAGSKVAGFSINGDFGLLIAYGGQPNFALTAGGFHPHYTPPKELTGMARVGIDLSPPAILTIRAQAYFALTANSFQLGTMVQLRADVGGVGAEGHLGFDALVRWSPSFAFEIDLTAGVSIYAAGMSFAGIDLRLHLEGPAPWVAHGTASISLLFFDIDVEVGPLTWGDDTNPAPDTVSPVELVMADLAKAASWRPVVPDGGDRVATLTGTAAPGVIVVHPLGAFEVRQHAVPLETVIDKVGPHGVTEHRVNFGAPTVGDPPASLPVAAVSAVQDRFAPAQFLNLTDDEMLSRPAFEDFPSGARFSGISADTYGAPVQSTYKWNTVYPHQPDLAPQSMAVLISPDLLGRIVAARGPVRSDHPYTVTADPVALADAGTVLVRGVDDLGPVSGVPAGPMTTTHAARLLQDLAVADPSERGQAQLVGLGVAP